MRVPKGEELGIKAQNERKKWKLKAALLRSGQTQEKKKTGGDLVPSGNSERSGNYTVVGKSQENEGGSAVSV